MTGNAARLGGEAGVNQPGRTRTSALMRSGCSWASRSATPAPSTRRRGRVVEAEGVEQRAEVLRERCEAQVVRRPQGGRLAGTAALHAHQSPAAAPERARLGGVAAQPVLEDERRSGALIEVGDSRPSLECVGLTRARRARSAHGRSLPRRAPALRPVRGARAVHRTRRRAATGRTARSPGLRFPRPTTVPSSRTSLACASTSASPSSSIASRRVSRWRSSSPGRMRLAASITTRRCSDRSSSSSRRPAAASPTTLLCSGSKASTTSCCSATVSRGGDLLEAVLPSRCAAVVAVRTPHVIGIA